MSYGSIERSIGRWLDSSPRIRGALKVAYQRLNYLVHARGSVRARVHEHVTMRRVCPDSIGASRAPECFFGYFGLSPWNRDGSRYLVHRWAGGERAEVCLVDPHSGDVLDRYATVAWNFQQGSMAQWSLDSGAQSVVFNDIVDRQLVCRIIGPHGGERQFPWPVQALRPGGLEALSLNYRRLARLRAEYGYSGEVDNFRPDQSLEMDGLWRVNLLTGAAQLAISLAQLTQIQPRPQMEGAEHKVNHALYSPSGAHFVFMHRFFGRSGKHSRLYSASADGKELRLLLDDRMVSHYAWRDDVTLLVWARTAAHGDHYYLLDTRDGSVSMCGQGRIDAQGDGHPSFSPDRRWIVTDTYPDRARRRQLFIYCPDTGERVDLGSFFAPWRYDGASRCDLHPRWSPDGRAISIDSAHEEIRANYILDLARLIST